MNHKTSHLKTSIRPALLLGLVICVGMISIALFFQYIMELEPCPLCSIERAIVIVLALVFFIGLIHGPMSWGRRIYALLISIVTSAGILVAARHSWLQHLPKEEVPECGPGLEFWINNLPLDQLLEKLFKGSGECAEVSWSFIGLSIPEWNLIIFVLFLFYSLKILFLGR